MRSDVLNHLRCEHVLDNDVFWPIVVIFLSLPSYKSCRAFVLKVLEVHPLRLPNRERET